MVTVNARKKKHPKTYTISINGDGLQLVGRYWIFLDFQQLRKIKSVC